MNSIDYNSGTVLIVEDDPLMMDLLTLYLQEANFTCVTVNNAENAWELLNETELNDARLQENSFDCVLLDRNLPGMSGMELLKKIKSQPVLMDLPVIIETGEGSDEAILEGLNNGAYYY